MDNSERNKGGLTDSGMCEPTQVQNRRSDPWPFRYSVTDRGIVINRPPPKKKGGDKIKEIGEALW